MILLLFIIQNINYLNFLFVNPILDYFIKTFIYDIQVNIKNFQIHHFIILNKVINFIKNI